MREGTARAVEPRPEAALLVEEAPRARGSTAVDAELRVVDVMRRWPLAVGAAEPLGHVSRALAGAGGALAHVVDERGELLGTVAAAGVLRALAEPGIGPGGPVAALLGSPVRIARPEWPVARAAAVMARHALAGLPVVSAGARRPEGVLEAADLVAWVARRCGYEVAAGAPSRR
jgi:CBS domain-containing protein